MHTTLHLLLFILLLSSSIFRATLSAQVKPGSQAMDIPSKFVLPESQVDIRFSAARLGGEVWKVYADREGVMTRSKPGKGKGEIVDTLSYLQPLYVYEDGGEYLRVVSDPKLDVQGLFSAEAEDHGWLPKQHALLWTHCLVVPGRHNQNLKALIINTKHALKEEINPFRYMKGDSLQCFQDPGLTQPLPTAIPMLGLYFIYKFDSLTRRDGGAVLLGLEIRTPQSDDIQRSVVGWVDADRLVVWEGQLALEPNTDEAAWEERKDKETQIQVLAAQEAADRVLRGLSPIPGSVWWNADPGDKRPLGTWWRFPVLGEKDGILKLGLIGSLPDVKDTLPTSSSVRMNDSGLEGRQLDDLREIHVLFAIGASEQLQPQIPALVTAIKKMLLEISKTDLGIVKLKYGAVVYRDYSNTEQTAEVLQLTNRPIQVLDFLIKQSRSTQIGNPDPPTAMFHGLQAALQATGTQPENSQLVILLGDAGDHGREDPSQVKDNDIIQLLRDYQCQLYACQVQNPGTDDTYEKFGPQFQLLYKMAAIQQYQRFKKDPSMGVYYPKLKEIDTHTIRIENGLTQATLVTSPKQTRRSMETIQAEMTQEILDMVARINEQWGEVPAQDLSSVPVRTGLPPSPEIAAQPKEEVGTPILPPMIDPNASPEKEQSDSLLASPYVSYLTPSAATYIQQARVLNSQQLKQITTHNFPVYLNAYAPMQSLGHEHAFFVYTRLYSRQELAGLIRELTSLAKSDENPDLRTSLHTVWKGLLAAHTGYISQEDANRLRFQQAGEMVFGMPNTHKIWEGRRLVDLLSRRAISDGEIQQYLRQIRDSLRELQRIFNANDYPYSFVSANRTYYWIREVSLP